MQGYNGIIKGITYCVSHVCIVGVELCIVVTAEADIVCDMPVDF